MSDNEELSDEEQFAKLFEMPYFPPFPEHIQKRMEEAHDYLVKFYAKSDVFALKRITANPEEPEL